LLIIPKTLLVVGIVAILFNPLRIQSVEQTIVVEEPIVWQYQELKRICSCESAGSPNVEPTHYKSDGSVLTGIINPRDIGICQINLDYHEKAAVDKGLDLFKERDNIKYAHYLYETEGNRPWTWSSSCWQD